MPVKKSVKKKTVTKTTVKKQSGGAKVTQHETVNNALKTSNFDSTPDNFLQNNSVLPIMQVGDGGSGTVYSGEVPMLIRPVVQADSPGTVGGIGGGVVYSPPTTPAPVDKSGLTKDTTLTFTPIDSTGGGGMAIEPLSGTPDGVQTATATASVLTGDTTPANNKKVWLWVIIAIVVVGVGYYLYKSKKI